MLAAMPAALISGGRPDTARAAPSAAATLFPRFAGAVPVLLYHRTPADFGAQMQRLHDLGFETISLDEYVRFVRGEAVALPPRPVLVTFDDGYRSALTLADPVLARYGWKAAVYSPPGAVGLPGRLPWAQLRQMQASGRWQIDEHAGDGHVLVTVDAAGRRAPYYANEVWSKSGLESFDHYKRRVAADIEHGLVTLARNIPGWSSHGTFAVPFGDYGQRSSDDPRIEPWLSAFLKDHFNVVFVQRGDRFTTPGPGFENRIHVPGTWTAAALREHLLLGGRQLHRAR